jgi:hypothetical protein
VRIALRLGLALLVLVVGFAGVSWLALESGGVAVIETRAPDGTTHATHVWTVEHDGSLWLEAGSPKNKWFADLTRDPHLRLTVAGATRDAVAEIVPDKSAEIRAALRAKYGWRDAWVQMLVNENRSTAVRVRTSP